MAQAVRRKWSKTLPDGTRVVMESKKWYAEYIVDGLQKRVPGYTDKGATEQLAARLEREACRGAEGLVDPTKVHRQRLLTDHLTDFAAMLTGKGDTADHVKLTVGRVRALFEGCGFRTPADVNLGKAQAWLTALRQPGPLSVKIPEGVLSFTPSQVGELLDISLAGLRAAIKRHKLEATGHGKKRRLPRATVQALVDRMNPGCGLETVNHYVRALRGFFGWMEREKRLGSNPLESLPLLNSKVEVRHGRRELPAEELRNLLVATLASAWVFRGLTGRDRYHLYLTAATTGLRATGLAGLTPAEFFLTGNTPTVTLPARFNKSRKPKILPIPLDVAEALVEYLAGKPAGVPVWGGTWAKDHRGAEMIRGDLEAAGIPYVVEGPDGPEYADFHALRHSFLTLGGRSGIDLRTLQELAGHSKPELTARYSHRRLHDLAGAVEKLPTLITPPATEEVEPTGTDRQ